MVAETGDWIDLVVFRAISRRARVVNVIDPSKAVCLHQHALDLFPRSSLEWLPATRAMDLRREQLLNERADTIVDLAVLMLGQDRHRELIPVLMEESAAQPGREDLLRLLMRTLYAADRKHDALARYEAHRLWVRDSLGTDPGLALQTLDRQIRSHDPVLSNPDPLPMFLPRDALMLKLRGYNTDPGCTSVSELFNASIDGSVNLPWARATSELLYVAAPGVQLPFRSEEFGNRVVRVAGDRYGITQVVDFGASLPTEQYSTHNYAARYAPGTKVAYTSADPTVVQAFGELRSDPSMVRMINEDMRRPERIMADPGFAEFIDLGRPALFLFKDEINYAGDPVSLVAPWIEAAAPGSLFSVVLATDEQMSDRVKRILQIVYRDIIAATLQERPAEAFASILEMLEPLVPVAFLEEIWDERPEVAGEMRAQGIVGMKR